MGVGVEGETCGVVAQGSREGFHIHAVLKGQGGEKVPHVVEANVFRANSLQYFVVDSPEGVWVVHGAGFGRGEHVWVAWMFPVFFGQQVHRLLRDRQRPDGVLCLGLADYQLTIEPVDLFCHRDCPVLCVQVSPEKSQQLAPSQTGGQLQVEQGEEAAAVCFCQI